MHPDNEERLAVAFETIAESLVRLVEMSENRYRQEYPPKKVPTDVTLSRVPTPEDRLKEDQGASDEPIDEWIGLREQAVLESTKAAG